MNSVAIPVVPSRVGSISHVDVHVFVITDSNNVLLISSYRILSTVSSLAIPAVPSGSIICILIILSSIGVHTTNVGLLMALEWFTYVFPFV